jgi:osmotically-inducible protein OsmY
VVRDDDWFQRKLREWGLSPDDLRRMSDNAGEAISRKGARLGEMASDVRIIAVVKAKFTLDDHLSGWDITVGCADGHVTLGGMVDSPEAIGRAIVLALDTEGVADVVSSLRVRPPAPQGNS